jgi:hypothetical protein
VLAGAIGASWAAVVFGLAVAPFAVVAHFARSLQLLNMPVGEIAEYRPPEMASPAA